MSFTWNHISNMKNKFAIMTRKDSKSCAKHLLTILKQCKLDNRSALERKEVTIRTVIRTCNLSIPASEPHGHSRKKDGGGRRGRTKKRESKKRRGKNDLQRMNQLSTWVKMRDPDLSAMLSDVTLTMRVAKATSTNCSDNIWALVWNCYEIWIKKLSCLCYSEYE